MRKLILNFIQRLTTCRICHGLGYIEIPGSGDTKPCRNCGGKGYV